MQSALCLSAFCAFLCTTVSCKKTGGDNDVSDSERCVLLNGADYQPSLGTYYLGFRGMPLCSAVIISNKTALTAAHCVEPLGDEALQVIVDRLHGESFDVMRVRTHPQFNRTRGVNDIAVLSFDPGTNIDSIDIAPVAASAQLEKYDSLIVEVAVPEMTSRGQRPLVPQLPNIARGRMLVSEVIDTQFSMVPQPSSTCKGASGGGIFVQELDGEPELVGIVTAGSRSHDETLGLRLAPFRDFIRQVGMDL